VNQEGPFAELTIRNEGRGISQSDLDRLFVQFERGTHPRTQSGVGLGLYIAKQLSETMGGTVAVSSQLNQGAIFTLKLPVHA
jgi:signal transduction histidine kinase